MSQIIPLREANGQSINSENLWDLPINGDAPVRGETVTIHFTSHANGRDTHQPPPWNLDYEIGRETTYTHYNPSNPFGHRWTIKINSITREISGNRLDYLQIGVTSDGNYTAVTHDLKVKVTQTRHEVRSDYLKWIAFATSTSDTAIKLVGWKSSSNGKLVIAGDLA